MWSRETVRMSSDGQENKRGRKRQSNDEDLSPAEMEKKEKNRLAAQRCRDKKEKQMEELRRKNEELVKENNKLATEKMQLSQKASRYKKVIKYHYNKGCKIPEKCLEMWNKQKIDESEDEDSNDEDIDPAEWTHEISTVPVSPDSTYSGNLSPKSSTVVDNSCRNDSGIPTALFSGNPLPQSDNTSIYSLNGSSSSGSNPLPQSDNTSIYSLNTSSSSSSGSSSSSYSNSTSSMSPALFYVSSAQTIPLSDYAHTDLFQLLAGSKVPAVLAPISKNSYRCNQIQTNEEIIQPNEEVEAPKTPINDMTTPAPNEGSAEIDTNPNFTIQSCYIPNGNLLGAEITFGNVQDMFESMEEENVIVDSQNLPSLGFNAVIAEGYSFSEELYQ